MQQIIESKNYTAPASASAFRGCFLLLAICLQLIFLLIAAVESTAQSGETESLTSSIFLPPGNRLNLYTKNYNTLSELQKWKIDVFGLRMAALDPRIWALRKIDRTENRQLIPIRPFFLRKSENSDFMLKQLKVTFEFEATKPAHIERTPERKTPLLDIEFSGKYIKGPPGEPALQDNAYLARLSGTPQLASGIYYRSQIKYLLTAAGAYPLLQSGRQQKVLLNFSQDEVALFINGEPFAQMAGDYRRGLLSLTAGWHPVKISALEVKGSYRQAGKLVPVSESGLVKK